MTKKSQQPVDDFLLENLGIKASGPGIFDQVTIDELRSLAEHGIRLRIALRSSGRIKDGLTGSLVEEDLNLYQLNEQQLKEKIDYHSKELQREHQTI